jgi:hypothetical protein
VLISVVNIRVSDIREASPSDTPATSMPSHHLLNLRSRRTVFDMTRISHRSRNMTTTRCWMILQLTLLARDSGASGAKYLAPTSSTWARGIFESAWTFSFAPTSPRRLFLAMKSMKGAWELLGNADGVAPCSPIACA